MLSFSFFGFISTIALARIWIEPRPVLKASLIPPVPWIKPAVGKSGPFTTFIKSEIAAFGLSKSIMRPSIISERLCGGMFVAMPTAIPDEPLISRFGVFDGRTRGSSVVSSKFGAKSTVSLSISASISSAIFVSLASVYLYAAGGSPSMEPKFPCPSTNG